MIHLRFSRAIFDNLKRIPLGILELFLPQGAELESLDLDITGWHSHLQFVDEEVGIKFAYFLYPDWNIVATRNFTQALIM